MKMNVSRTAKSIKNSVVSMIFYFINLILQFYSRKIFLDYLGTEILGLNTTLTNILQFLNLAELGIGSAVGFFLYKPLEECNQEVINDIVSFQGFLYKRIGLVVFSGGCIVSLFFSWIFEKSDLPLWYAYSTFGVLIFSALLGYFVNYKQILLSAAQEGYKIQYSYKSIILVKVLVQILCMRYFEFPYVSWLVCEFVFSIFASISLSIVTKRTFPCLISSKKSVVQLRACYKEIETKVKQIFFHQVSGFVLTQTSPLIIYMYLDLTEVALYGNYNLIVAGIISLMTALFNSIIPGIGSFMIKAQKDQYLKLFNQLFSFRFWFGSIVSFCVLCLSQTFISLWIGSQYLLPFSTLVLITTILFLNIIRLGAESFLSAMGMYSDIWAPIIESILNLGLSILLGYYWGLNGVLIGVIIALILIPLVWKSYFLFNKGFKTSYFFFIKLFSKHIIITFVFSAFFYVLISFKPIPTYWSGFLIYSALILCSYGVLLMILYSICKFDLYSLFIKLLYTCNIIKRNRNVTVQ